MIRSEIIGCKMRHINRIPFYNHSPTGSPEALLIESDAHSSPSSSPQSESFKKCFNEVSWVFYSQCHFLYYLKIANQVVLVILQ